MLQRQVYQSHKVSNEDIYVLFAFDWTDMYVVCASIQMITLFEWQSLRVFL